MEKSIAILALAGALCFSGSALPQTIAAGTRTTSASLDPVGLAVTETIAVNLVNTAVAPSGSKAASCAGSVAFFNGNGTAIGTATSFTLSSGQIAAIDLQYASVGAAGARAVVRPVVNVTTTYPSPPPCELRFALETFDTSSGVTHLHTPGGVLELSFGR